jgi:LPXTG-site transpeptidase (sortase) family protein
MKRRHAVIRLTIAGALFVGSMVFTGMPASATANESNDAAPTQLDVTSGKKTKLAKGTLANVRIPAIGVTTPLKRGIGDNVLAKGLGLWPGTGKIGQPGNAVIAGHRTSHTRPLFDIHKLKKGDAIFFTTAQGVAEYRVTKRQIVKPDAMWITRPTKASTITLFACHPPHSIAYRWVVFAKLHSMTPHKAVKLSQ